MKKLMIILLSLLIILSLGAPAFADSGSMVATVKIPNAPAVVGYLEAGVTVPAKDAGNGLLSVENGFVESKWVYFFPVSGTLLTKYRAEVFIKFFDLGEKVEVLSIDGNIAKINVDGVEAEMETRFLRMKGEDRFESFIVYTRPGNTFRADPWLRDFHTITFKSNTEVTVLDKLGDNCYLVDAQGVYLFSTGESFSLAPYEAPYEPNIEPNPPANEWSVPVK